MTDKKSKVEDEKVHHDNEGWTNAIDNSPFWDFEESPIFEGVFDQVVTMGKGKKAFDAFRFFDLEGETYNLNKNYSIVEAIENLIKIANDANYEIQDYLMRIKFLGKTEVNGKPFRQFKVDYKLRQ